MALQTKTYSVGSFDRYTGTSNGYILDLILTEESTDLQANTSLVSYKLQMRSGPSNRFDWELTAALALNGAAVAQVTAENYLDYNSVWVLLEGQLTVPHNNDGALALAYDAVVTPWDGGTQYTPPELSLTGAMTLTAIPRASGVAATAAFIGDASTIVVSRKSAEYTHSIHYQFGNLSGYLADAVGSVSQDEVKLTDTTILFPVPVGFYYQIPAAPTGICTLTCITYQGDVPIGDPQVAEFTVTADPARCRPVLTGTAVDTVENVTALTGSDQIFVRGQSNVLCTATLTVQYGATIASLWVNGLEIAEASVTISKIQTAAVTFRARDSRGYETEYTVPGLSLVDYADLSSTVSARRLNPTDGTARLNVSGTWYAGSFGEVQNSLSVQYRKQDGDWTAASITTDGGKYSAVADLAGLDYQQSHVLEIKISDALQTQEKRVTVGRGIPVFDWGERDFAFHVPVRFIATDGTEFTLDLVDGQLTAVI